MKEIVITWWMDLMMASTVVMFAIFGILKLRECGVCPLRAMTRFVQRNRFERWVLLAVVCGMVQYDKPPWPIAPALHLPNRVL